MGRIGGLFVTAVAAVSLRLDDTMGLFYERVFDLVGNPAV
jgi:hypothetical protein